MKVWRLGNCENFVGKREEIVFNAFVDCEPVERAYDGSDMAGSVISQGLRGHVT